MKRTLVYLSCLSLLAIGCSDSAPRDKAQTTDAKDFVAAMNEAPPYQALAAKFVSAAANGDVAAMRSMLSKSKVSQLGEAGVDDYLRKEIVPFFAGRQIMNWQNVAGADDGMGHAGYSFYMYTTDGAGRGKKPFTVYVVKEDEKLVVSDMVVNKKVKGRHG